MQLDGSERPASLVTPDVPKRAFTHFWEAPVFAKPLGLLLFWVLLLLVAALRCRIGLYGTNYVSHDAFMVLDGAWRMLHHQRPHVDFNSMIGPVAYLPSLVGLRLLHDNAKGLAVGQSLAGLVLAAWCFLLGRRMPDVPRAFYTLCVLAYVLSPAQLGLSPFFLTPGMTYNRLVYGLLAVVLLECLLPQRHLHLLAGCSTGVALALLLFTKFTTVLPGCLLLLLLLPQKVQTWRRWAGMIGGALAVTAVAAAYLGFHLHLVAHDLALTLGAKQVHITTLYTYDALFLEAALGVLVAALLAVEMGSLRPPAAGGRLLLAAVAVAGISILVVLSNWQQEELPLVTLFLLIAVSRALPEQGLVPGVAPGAPPRSAPLSALRGSSVRGDSAGWAPIAAPLRIAEAGVAVFALVPVLSLCASLAAGSYAHDVLSKQIKGIQFSDTLRDFVPADGDIDYTDFVNNGIALLWKEMRPGERVMSLDFTNPFSLAFKRPPAPGGSTNLQFGGSFNYLHYVPPEQLFGQAELVMLPLVFSDPTLQETVPKLYGPYLHEHYHLVGELKRWQLYRRNEPHS